MNTGSPITPITSPMFRGRIARLAGLECDMLLTPHPSASGMISRAAEGSFESGISCRDYASAAEAAGRAIGRSRRQVTSWKLTAYAPKPVIHAALLAHDEYGTGIPISSFREARSRRIGLTTGFWRPGIRKAGQDAEARRRQPVCRQGSKIRIEKLPDADWLVLSQQEVEPIRAGRFLVRTPNSRLHPRR